MKNIIYTLLMLGGTWVTFLAFPTWFFIYFYGGAFLVAVIAGISYFFPKHQNIFEKIVIYYTSVWLIVLVIILIIAKLNI